MRRLAALARLLGLPVHPIHAQQQQRQRLKSLDRFKADENGVLIATDVAARGLDIPQVKTVVHFQLPASADIYVHRSGRTGRAGREGVAIALVAPSERARFVALLRVRRGWGGALSICTYTPPCRRAMSSNAPALPLRM